MCLSAKTNYMEHHSEQEAFELRLKVMIEVRKTHEDEYYQQAAKSRGADIHKMSHAQISLWKATLDSIEADAMIEVARDMPVSKASEIEMPVELFNTLGT
jgi:hypothetical protein